MKYKVGIDVGGTKIAYGLFDERKELIDRYQVPSDPQLEPEDFFLYIIEEMKKLLGKYAVRLEQIQGIGIGMPSFVLFEEGMIVKTSTLPKIQNFYAKSYLHKLLGSEIAVVIDNDSHTGALAEHRYGAGKDYQHMLYCPVSTGISSGIIINGQLFRGSYGWSGESGHMLVSPGEGIACGCGNRGCLMSYCSGRMIIEHIKEKIQNGESTFMERLAGHKDNITAHHLLAAYDQGDQMALWAVEQMAEYMGVWLYNLYSVLNINCFVFGGGLVHFGDRLFPKVKTVFDGYNKNDMPVYFKFAELEEDFGVIGAMELLS